MVINNEEKLIILKKLEVPRNGQVHSKIGELDPQDGVVGM